MSTTLSIFFKTYGCQANVADSAGIATYLEGLGCRLEETAGEADLIIINTCAIREKAEQKLYSYLGELAEYKKTKPYLKIGVIGCVASYRKKEMLDRFEYVSFVSGARDERGTFLAYLADLIVRLQTAKQLYIDAHSTDEPLFTEKEYNHKSAQKEQDHNIAQVVQHKKLIIPSAISEIGKKAAFGGTLPIQEKKEVVRSFVNITSGCNNYCTYCIVPFTRGREISYPLEDLVMQVAHDVQKGAKEITLVGQNVNSYQCPITKKGFADLLRSVAQIPGAFWVRYVSPHPKDMTQDVLHAMAHFPDKLCAWIHFPLQAGSTRVLSLMNRTYSKEEYLEQVRHIRTILPHTTITTDVIVGFPGETYEEFLETLEVAESVRFDHMFSFIYSRRKYTKAYRMGDTCSVEDKQQRLEILQKRQIEICKEQNSAYIGKKVRVLVEKQHINGKLLARTEGNHRVFFNGTPSLIGSFQQVTVTAAAPAHLEAVLL